jgi:large subunit ribosomal protein L27e
MLTEKYRVHRYPKKITKRMGAKRQHKHSRVKPFIKIINYNHLMPTRYTLELEGLKGTVAHDTFKEVTARQEARKNIKKVFEDRFQTGKNKWFFTPLRF